MGSTEPFFFEDDCRRAGFISPARHRGDGGASRETDSIFSTLRARRAGHGARARARLATDGSPVDSPSAEASGAEICLSSPSRKRPAGRKNTILLCYIFFMNVGLYFGIFCTHKALRSAGGFRSLRSLTRKEYNTKTV